MLLVFGWFLAGHAAPLLAETRRILTLDFDIDRLEQVDQKSTRIVIGSENWIAPTSQLDAFVVSHYLEKRARVARFSMDGLLGFVREAVARKQFEMAASALAAALNYPEPQQVPAEFVDSMKSEDEIGVLRKAVLAVGDKSAQPGFMARALVHLSMHDANWTRASAPRLVLTYADEIKKLASQNFNTLVKAGKMDEAERILNLLGDLYGPGDEAYEELRKRHGRVQYILQGLAGEDVATWSAYVSMAIDDPILADILYPMVLEKLHTEAAKSIDEGNFQRALSVLANVEMARRTPRTHQLVAQALEGLKPGEKVAADPQVDQLLSGVAQRDEAVRSAYVTFLESEFEYLLRQGLPIEAESYFRRLLRVRPDPDSRNDGLRIDHAISFKRNGLPEKARSKIDEVHPGASPWIWFRVLLFSLYAHPVYGTLGLFACLGLGFVVYLLLTERWQPRPVKRPTRPVVREARSGREIPTSEMPRFVVSGLKEQLDPDYQEYVNCLKVFGLRPGANLSAIKNAYRNAVKEYHPDLNREAQDMAAEVFIEMTRTYERLIQLHSKHGV